MLTSTAYRLLVAADNNKIYRRCHIKTSYREFFLKSKPRMFILGEIKNLVCSIQNEYFIRGFYFDIG